MVSLKPTAKHAFARSMLLAAAVSMAVVLACFVSACGSASGSKASSVAANSDAANSGAVEYPMPDTTPTIAYSWSELSVIANEIAAAGDELGGIEVAKRYGLCTPEGTLDGTQTVQVQLDNGFVALAQIVGFNHDNRSDGLGKAGITFIFKDCVAELGLNKAWSNQGGWAATELRAWLQGEMYSLLPDELAGVVLPVEKPTNNVGVLEDTSFVNATSDLLWLPSTRELCGNVDWNFRQTFDNVLNAEGEQYKLYRDAGVVPNGDNPVLSKTINGKPCSWWARSPLPIYQGFFQFVHSGGDPHVSGFSYLPLGIAPCFCI